ncbi:hypothetical protein HY29_18305 [Hyphomonas beringensis]|uniref:Uncharacterized protein n=2 Tax=Hyphomonas beringensis TaxID=1280946 RepID=A0A062U1B3_9PROT|nr:hypothetical protein HY29_18305 [Hyphomonas beringensis]
MGAVGLAQVDQFVFTPRYKSELQVLVLENELARPVFAEFFKQNSPVSEIVGDSAKLKSLHQEIHKRIKYEKPRRKLGGYVNTILNAGTITETGFAWNLGGLLNHQNPCAAPITLPSLIIIYEDSIEREQLCAFFSLFKQIEPQYCPAIIFVSETRLNATASLLASCGSDVDVLALGPDGVHELSVRAQEANSLQDFLALFLAEADGACLASVGETFGLSGHDRGELGELAVGMLRVQSLFRQGRKFDGKSQIDALERRISVLKDATNDADLAKEYLYMRALLDLWHVFITENQGERIQNAIAIADHLGDEILLAHALKQVDMLHGYGTLTKQQLMRAKSIFHSHGEMEHALFIENNAIVNDLYTGANCAPQASSMSDYVQELCPHIRRSTTFHSNAGIAHLIIGQEDRSLEFFQRAIAGSGPPVNKLTSEINQLIARYVDGDKLDTEDAMRFMRRMERSNIPSGFDYHQTTMLANLWKMFQANKDAQGEIRETLRRRAFMPYDEHLESPDRLLRYVLSYYGAVSGLEPGEFSGQIGAFFERHGLWPSAHVFYR